MYLFYFCPQIYCQWQYFSYFEFLLQKLLCATDCMLLIMRLLVLFSDVSSLCGPQCKLPLGWHSAVLDKTNTFGGIKPWKMRLVRHTGPLAKAWNVDKMLVLNTYYTRPGSGMSAKFGLHVGNMKFNNRMKKELGYVKFYV
jgi:hypothetical protein